MKFCLSSLLPLASGLIAAPLAAQSAPCAALNDATANVTRLITARSNARPNSWGWRFNPTRPLVARGLRIFTNNKFTTGFMKLEIWDEDAKTKLPGKRLAQGTWYAPKDPTPSWQGANFERSLVLTSTRPVWFVWVEIGWATVPIEPGGKSMSGAVRWNGSSWQTGGLAQLKFRLFCTSIDTKGTKAFGSPCNAASGATGTAFTNQSPKLGTSTFRIEGTNLPAGAPALFLIGGIPAFKSISLAPLAPGCFLNTDLVLILTGATGTGDVRAATAFGHTFLPLPVGFNPSLKGLFFATQIAVADAKSTHPLKLVFTNAMRATVF